MFKNSTPREVAFVAAIMIASMCLGAFSIIYLLVGPSFDISYLFLVSFVVLIISFAVILTYLRTYIYRKIKLIYKTIRRHKVSTDLKSSTVNVDHPIIDEVEQEVAEWAKAHHAELERYKSFAEFRRRYIGDISHELKTPIFNIQGYLHTLLDGGLEDEAVARPFLMKAAKNTERLQIIVDDLNAINRLESGDMILDKEDFDIKVLAAEVMDEMDMKAKQNGVELVFKEGASSTFNVYADRETIRQVLTNLINNSINYGESGGSTKIAFYNMDDLILVEVADNGIGIPEKHIPHLFDRFYRVDKSRSRARGGSGLGLAIVKHILEAHQQSINVRSTPGLGSTFGFTLKKA